MTRASATKTVKPDLQRAVRLVTDLMQVPGVSGREGKIAAQITRRLREAGVPASAIRRDAAHKRIPEGGETGNLIVTLPGTVRGPRRMLMAHMDTVPVCLGGKPVRRGGYLVSSVRETGIGGDDRARSAIILTALGTILAKKLSHPPLTFLWTVQEELGLLGSRYAAVSKLGRPAMGFNFDGGDRIATGATGAYRMMIDIRGIAAHAGTAPHKGVSATAVAGLAIGDLQKRGWLGAVRKGPQRGTSNVGIIEAGPAVNIVCPHAQLKAEARSHDPLFRKRMLDEFRNALADAATKVRDHRGRCGKISFKCRLDYESFRLDDGEPCIAEAVRAARAVGAKTERTLSDGGLDANWMFVHGIPTVTLGTGNENAHTPAERLNVAKYQQMCRLALHLATDAR